MTDGKGRVPVHGCGVLHDFKGGYDPRRAVGAPSLGRRITAKLNEYGREDENGNALYPEAALREIIDNPKSAHPNVIAAGEIVRARMDGFDKIERVPKAANSIDRIIDRTEGKPTQTIRVETQVVPPPAEAWADLIDALIALPADQRSELRTMLDSQLGGAKAVENMLARGPKATCGETIDEQGRVLLPAPSSLFPKDADDDGG